MKLTMVITQYFKGITTSRLYSRKQMNLLINSDEQTDLVSLRKEIKQLRMGKEILKKARAFFAKEMK